MAGLLSGIGSKVGGLLGDPNLKDAFWLTLASGADPRRASMLKEDKRIADEEARMEEYRKIQMEQARMQMQQAQDAQQRQQYTQALLSAGSSQNPALMQDPTFQAQLRQKAAAYGDPAALEQGGLLAPLPTSTELPADARLFEWAKGNPERMAFVQRSNQAQVPANIQEWQQYQAMTPEQQAAYINMKRAGNMFDVGGVPQYRGAGGEVTPLATPEQVAANRGQQSAAQAAGTETGKAGVTAQMQLPQAVASGEQMYQHLEALKSHPGLSYAVGKSSVLPVIPGTPAADFKVRLDQVQGAQFLQAYETLKGGGQITEVEGKKAEAAIARMNRAQTEEEFKRSVEDFQSIVAAGVERAKAKANSGYAAPVPNSSQAQGNAEAERAALRAKHGL